MAAASARATTQRSANERPRSVTTLHPESEDALTLGATHWWASLQTLGATQSSTETHSTRQVPALLHLNGAQSCTLPLAPVVV